jgi:hypothetical protein
VEKCSELLDAQAAFKNEFIASLDQQLFKVGSSVFVRKGHYFAGNEKDFINKVLTCAGSAEMFFFLLISMLSHNRTLDSQFD